MNGIALTEHLRGMPDVFGSLPIVAITANTDATKRIELFAAGIDDYLAKPVLAEEMVVRLRRLIERQALLQAKEAHEKQLECLVQQRTAQYLQAQASLQALLDSMAEAAFGMDANGLCTFVNRAFLTPRRYWASRYMT